LLWVWVNVVLIIPIRLFIRYRKDFVIATGGIDFYESDNVASLIADALSNQYIGYQLGGTPLLSGDFGDIEYPAELTVVIQFVRDYPACVYHSVIFGFSYGFLSGRIPGSLQINENTKLLRDFQEQCLCVAVVVYDTCDIGKFLG